MTLMPLPGAFHVAIMQSRTPGLTDLSLTEQILLAVLVAGYRKQCESNERVQKTSQWQDTNDFPESLVAEQ